MCDLPEIVYTDGHHEYLCLQTAGIWLLKCKAIIYYYNMWYIFLPFSCKNNDSVVVVYKLSTRQVYTPKSPLVL